MNGLLEVKDITVETSEKEIISSISFSAESPSWVAILGASGIGKSTLLGAIARVIPISKGKITYKNSAVNASCISLMTQQDSLLPWLNTLDNVVLGFHLRKNFSKTIADKAMELLDRVELTGKAKDYPSTLSGGMRQRVMLARTLIEDKEIILMDEPFSALDAITRHKLGNMSKRLLASNLTIMVTHDPQEAIRLADKIYLMNYSNRNLEKIEHNLSNSLNSNKNSLLSDALLEKLSKAVL